MHTFEIMRNRKLQEQMNEEAKTELRTSGLFVTAEKLAELFGKDPREFAARLADWKYHAEIFSIEDASTELFPLFVFERGDNVRPNRAGAQYLSTRAFDRCDRELVRRTQQLPGRPMPEGPVGVRPGLGHRSRPR